MYLNLADFGERRAHVLELNNRRTDFDKIWY
jgi:hypothetical protein